MPYFLKLLLDKSKLARKMLGKKPPLGDNMAANALVAQLDRAPGYEPGGQRFESSPVHSFLLQGDLTYYDP